MTYLEPTQAAGRAYFASVGDGEITMLNLLRFRPVADYGGFPDLAPSSPISGDEAYRLYIEHTLPLLRESGGDLTLVAEGGAYLIGPAEQRWDRVMLVRHRSAAAFLAFASDQDYLAGKGHRTAALEDSRLLPLVVRSDDAPSPSAAVTRDGSAPRWEIAAGRADPTPTAAPEEDLERIVRAASERLSGMTEGVAEFRAHRGGWSSKEILGHLIDSATINHARFIRAANTEDLVFDGYDQDAWVTAQAYQSRPWPDLLTLWEAINLHLANAMARIPGPVREQERPRHSLNRIAWRLVSEDEPTTLEYFLRDYVNHLEHHLAQIDALADPSRGVSPG